jgi:hypothetical protein
MDLIGTSQLLKPTGVIFNPNIESCPLASTDGLSIPVTAESLRTQDRDEFQRSAESLGHIERT